MIADIATAIGIYFASMVVLAFCAWYMWNERQ